MKPIIYLLIALGCILQGFFIKVEHEEKYMAQGVKIKFGLFRMKPEAPDFDPTRFRLTPGIKKEAIERMNRAVMPSDQEEK